MGRSRILAEEHRRALDRLKAVPGIEHFYLAGGTAVAFHLRHRTSQDLDLFSLAPDADLDGLRTAVGRTIRDATILEQSDATLRLRVCGVPVDVVSYPYPPLAAPKEGPEQFPTAALIDLAVMKVAAIARRGLRRDFWDLHEIVRSGIHLRDILTAYLKRFGKQEADLYHVMRALTWFEDAERTRAYPTGLTRKKWDEIKRFFEREAARLLDELE